MQLWPQNSLTKLSPISASERAPSDKKTPEIWSFGCSNSQNACRPKYSGGAHISGWLFQGGVRRLEEEIRSKMPVTGCAAPTCYNEHNGHMHYLRRQRPTIVLCSQSLPCHLLNSSSRELKNHIESDHMQATGTTNLPTLVPYSLSLHCHYCNKITSSCRALQEPH